MPWSGTGNFTRTNGTNTGSETWQDDAAVGTKIRADNHDVHDQDLASAISECLTQNNESKPTANFLPNASASYDLGSASVWWKDGFFQSLTLGTGVVGRDYLTLADSVYDVANLKVDQVITLKERTTGNGGGLTGDVIADTGGAAATAEGGYSLMYLGSDLTLQLREPAGPWVKKTVFVDQWGAEGNGTASGGGTDSYGAIQAAINTLTSGGNVMYSQASYRVSAPLLPASDEVFSLWHVGQNKLKTIIIADHLAGPGIKLNRTSSGVKDLSIEASNSRQVGAIGGIGNNVGLHIEGDDTAGNAVAVIRVMDVKIHKHPNHGMMVVGNCQGFYSESLETTNNGGHGAWFHEGTATGRVTPQNPGIATLVNHWSINNGGHSLCLGHTSDTITSGPFRFNITNPEYGFGATNAATRLSTDQVWIRATNLLVTTPATGNSGWRIAGKNLKFINTRWIDTTYSFNVDADHALGVTEGIDIDGIAAINVTHDPSVIVNDLVNVSSVYVKSYIRDRITSLITPGVKRAYTSYLGPDLITIIKNSSDTVNNSTTYADDSELIFPLDANELLSFKLKLRYSGDVSADIKFKISVPAGVTVRWGPVNALVVGTLDTVIVTNEKTESGEVFLGCASTSRWTELIGYIDTSTFSGDFKIQFAQVSAQVADTHLLPGSSLEINRSNQV